MIATTRSPSSLGWVGSVRRFWFRHPERSLAGVALLAWVGVAFTATNHVHAGAGASLLTLQGGWLLMVAAMMIPPALPMARHVGLNSKRYRRHRAMFLFAGSALMIWVVIGLVLTFLVATAGVAQFGRWLLGGSLLLAAVWELTPAKRRAIKACHRTIPLPPDGRRADRACIRLGMRYGNSCFAACWALMLPMALVGHVGVALMLLLTAIAVAEEVVRKGYRLAPEAAALLTAASVMVLVLG